MKCFCPLCQHSTFNNGRVNIVGCIDHILSTETIVTEPEIMSHKYNLNFAREDSQPGVVLTCYSLSDLIVKCCAFIKVLDNLLTSIKCCVIILS